MITQDNDIHSVDEPFDGIKELKGTKPPIYFYVLFYGSIIWAVIFCGYYLFSGWSSHGEFQEKMAAHQEQAVQNMQGGK